MKIFFKFFIVLLVAVGGLLLFAHFQPDEYQVERKLEVQAPRSVVYPYISDLKKFTQWSPWTKRDPDMKMTFSGPVAGVGAKYEWAGNDDVGRGSMEIVEAAGGSFVKTRIVFIEPFESQADTRLDLEPKGQGVEVRWTMKGKNNLVSKVIGLFMDMDAMIGNDFEQGLASLKHLAEKDALPPEKPNPGPAPEAG